MIATRTIASGTVVIMLLGAACSSGSEAADESPTAVTEAAESTGSSAPETAPSGAETGTDTATTDTATTDTGPATTETSATDGRGRDGGGGNVSAASVSSEQELITLINSAYGDPGLGLHRGHRPVEATLIDFLGISHDEMHVRMEAEGQNLDAVATDLGLDDQDLVAALTDSWSPAIDTLVENGTITEDQASNYRQALTDAFTYRVTWNGSDPTPTFTGV